MGLYAAKCPRPGLKPRAPAVRTEPLYIGHALYQLSQWAPPCHHLTSQCAWETLKPREDMFYRTCRCECWLLKSWHQMCITSYAIFEECHGFHEYFKVHRTDHAMCSAGFRNFEKYGVCWKSNAKLNWCLNLFEVASEIYSAQRKWVHPLQKVIF